MAQRILSVFCLEFPFKTKTKKAKFSHPTHTAKLISIIANPAQQVTVNQYSVNNNVLLGSAATKIDQKGLSAIFLPSLLKLLLCDRIILSMVANSTCFLQ